ncbi:MAG: response regulator [Granulosicoccus sp.]
MNPASTSMEGSREVETELVVLVIEDNDQDFFLLHRRLRQARDVRLQRESTLAQGLDTLATQDVDLVLLDLSLPDSQGLETVSTVVTVCTCPVVVLTATDDEGTGVQALHRGAQDYLIKGHIDAALLTRAIRYSVERYKLLDQLQVSREKLAREREFRRLRTIALHDNQKASAERGRSSQTLRERESSGFHKAASDYATILDKAVDQRLYKVDHQLSGQLKELAELLGAWCSQPQDVVEIHTTAIALRLTDIDLVRGRLYNEEARFLLTGALGHLCRFYSDHCDFVQQATAMSSKASNDSEMDLI